MSITNPRLSQKYPKQMQEFDRLLAELDSLIPKQALKEFRLNSEPAKLFQLVHYRLRQSRKEFDALLFFAVCFGMLKSGKSTLVNLLAGHPEASPARFGIDTTLRPCLVLAGTKNEITTFQMMDSMKAGDTDEAERGCFNAVIDHLRGMIESEDELAAVHHVVVRRTSLTEDNIIKALTSKDIGIEPLITVVRLDGPSELLRSGIALLDVPGMDSYKMGTAVPRYIELLERCDLLLFIQSTISPLNQGAASMLKQLVERSRGSPVWLIQNRFEAQNWRNPKGVAEQDSELTEVAKNQLGAEIGIKPHLIFAKQVNLGKAYDARFQQEKLRADIRPDDLLEESGFPEIERELFTKINEERLDIQLANCLNQLNDALQKNRVTLAELEKWIADEAARLFSFITEFDGVIARFSSKSGLIPTLGMDNQNESVAARIKQRFETYRDQWKALIVYGLEQWKSSIRDKMIGDEFNDELYRRIDELYIRGIE
ncbi:MAG: dynamin family protein, partial [Actinomycetes bacterium]